MTIEEVIAAVTTIIKAITIGVAIKIIMDTKVGTTIMRGAEEVITTMKEGEAAIEVDRKLVP